MSLLEQDHYAVIYSTSSTRYTPGDERSRTNPGHGYPESWETITNTQYVAFETIQEVEDWVKWKGERTPGYRIIKASPLKVTTEVKVSIG